VSLRDDVEMRLFEFTLNGPHRRPDFYELADAILALVRAHLTSDEAKVRAMSAAWKAYETEQGGPPEGADAMFMAVCAAVLAALGDTHD